MRLPALVCMLGLAGCGGSASIPPPTAATVPDPVAQYERLPNSKLENAYRVNANLYSGGSPDGDAAFRELQQLGIRTIVSVDGMTPDLDRAKQYQMRYVHLPVGYDGIPQERAWQLARALQDLPKPIYLHCHHGKHRGPAAIAAALLCIDDRFTPEDATRFTPEDATRWMTAAGTDPKYRGLIEVPTRLKKPTAEQWKAIPTDFPSQAQVPDLTAVMVKLDAAWDAIKAAKKHEWKDGPAQAVLLAEHYRESARLKRSQDLGPDFLDRLRQAERDAEALAETMRKQDRPMLDAAFARSSAQCANCHARYRD